MMKENNAKRPAVFIDRDGTLIEEVNFLSRVEDLRLFPFTADAIAAFRNAGFLIIVITNQSGIHRGKYGEADMHSIHDQIQADLGGAIDGFYFCPHLPSAGCDCRKPSLGMINAALADFQVDLERSWFIGDKKIDVETGHNAGIRSAMVMTGYGRKHLPLVERDADFVGDDLLAAARHITATHGE